MQELRDILVEYESNSKTNREKGDYFEQLVQNYLVAEPMYQYQVQKYSDWAEQRGIERTDTGIDLVALDPNTQEFIAVQCKFWDDDKTLNKSDLDSFIAGSSNTFFQRRLLVTTNNKLHRHAEATIRNSDKPFNIISMDDLQNSKIDWSQYGLNQQTQLKPQKTLRKHQQVAVDKVIAGLQIDDRGKMIMACGTGKTFTSLKIAEQLVGESGLVLFMVPSLALLSQTLREWSQESELPLLKYAVCSDFTVGTSKDQDFMITKHSELNYPATTYGKFLAKSILKDRERQPKAMTVIFSTYHSIQVLIDAQRKYRLPSFNLIICDEAHRTTGATFAGEDESNFVKVHDNNLLSGDKRLYMTATPRIFAPSDKKKADVGGIQLCSMDDQSIYGRELYTLNFSSSVEQGLLVDYKVLVLTVDQDHVSDRLQELFKDDNNELNLDDAAKIVGCWKALNKMDEDGILTKEKRKLQRSVAYCQVIDATISKGKQKQKHKVGSKQIADQFAEVVEVYRKSEPGDGLLHCEAEHIDGTMNAIEKGTQITWLKDDIDDGSSRILCNVRCLSEGVDIPALDSIMFLSPRQSQIEVVQSVGRVMRKVDGKNMGYIIIPVVIPRTTTPEKALDDNKTYKIVWEILQALRAHDDRFDSYINKMDLQNDPSGRMEVIAVAGTPKSKAEREKEKRDRAAKTARSANAIGKPEQQTPDQLPGFEVSPIERALYAKVVQKCGNRMYWDEWASDVAKIAQTHITRISTIVSADNPKEHRVFIDFVSELRKNINNQISESEVIEMLAQHLITQPVFEALFTNYQFGDHNPVSRAMHKVLEQLQQHNIHKESAQLQGFYNSIKLRVEGIDNAEGRQKVIVELYDKFFRAAFPKMAERLGIVYTPVECVDFIIHSVNDVLKNEFGQTLGDENTHIIDPFTGTGTFITRLIQSGLLTPAQLQHKFAHELHANEIVLLAYYIASINIESAYYDVMRQHSAAGKLSYQAFPGICLTDTFQLYEQSADLLTPLLPVNSERLNKLKNLDIKVIIGNPPYSAGQKSGNDNNQNLKYEKLDASIEQSYAQKSKATLKNSLYDSYIRAIRWASDRIGDAGVIGYITNAGWLDANAMDGMRQTLAEEFSSIYVFHLRGGIRGKSADVAKKEGQNVFNIMTAVAITLLVKNPNAQQHGQIYYCDIGDYLNREQKLEKIVDYGSIEGISTANAWQTITPDKFGDWLNQRDDSFYEHIVMGDKKGKGTAIFANYSSGLKTNRDAWVYNASKTVLANNVQRSIDFYNSELERYQQSDAIKNQPKNKQQAEKYIAQFVNSDKLKIAFSRDYRYDIFNQKIKRLDTRALTNCTYRPFTKTNAYYDGSIMMELYQMPKIFPEAGIDNLVIAVSGKGANSFSCLISDKLIDLHLLESGTQCFPLHIYSPFSESKDLFTGITVTVSQPGIKIEGGVSDKSVVTGDSGTEYKKFDGITNAGLQHFSNYYGDDKIGKEDVFYYIYGLLHSPEYRRRYAHNLHKDLPRIPRVKTVEGFWAFSRAGRQLADLHLNYEQCEEYPATVEGEQVDCEDRQQHYRVQKMKFAKKGDKSSIIYNGFITVKNIPETAYNYVVNGKSAIEWVMERQCVSTHKDSGIVNDANHWATETVGDPRYPLSLLLKVIKVSLQTTDIVKQLPKLDIEHGNQQRTK